jgi:hypothetical protein
MVSVEPTLMSEFSTFHTVSPVWAFSAATLPSSWVLRISAGVLPSPGQ